jgi:hypothetical protein
MRPGSRRVALDHENRIAASSVAGERMRDKIVASKAKGLSMGDVLPLGYGVFERKLVVNAKEASLACEIVPRHAEHGSAAQLVRELAAEGQTSKSWVTQTGNFRPGSAIDQRMLLTMLGNRICLGEMPFKGKSYLGQHEAIVSREVWEAVQAFVVQRKQGPRDRRAKHPVLLAGLLFEPDGQRMLNSYVTKKSGRRYRYDVPYLHKRRKAGATERPGAACLGRMPAGEIEAAVLQQIQEVLRAPQMLAAVWQTCRRHPEGAALDEAQVVMAMPRIGELWDQLFQAEQRRIARLLIERVQLHAHGLDILWREDGWAGREPDVAAHPRVAESIDGPEEACA